MSDLWFLLYWFIVILVVGISGWPLLWLLLKRLPDGGFGVSIPFSTVVVGWAVWMLSSIHFVPFSPASVWAVLLGLVAGSSVVGWKKKEEFFRWVQAHQQILLFEVTLFALSLFAWGLVRAYQPDIQGLEKFMDGGFVQSILRSPWMPPQDPWLTGFTINYYYFGHFLAAVLTTLSGLELSATYNLLIATIFALSMLGSFSVVYNFVGGRRGAALAGILAALLLNLGGNLHTAWHLLFRPGVSYWYPDATRFIPYTIHEFPAYSHIVADLHGHLLNLPIVLLFLVLLIAFVTPLAKAEEKQVHHRALLFSALFGFLLGIFSMTNTWDVPIYGLVVVGVMGMHFWGKKTAWVSWFKNMGTSVVTLSGVLIFTSILFHIHFANIAKGVAFVEARSALWQLAVLWGGFLTISLVSIWCFFRNVLSELTKPYSAEKDGRSFLPLVMIGVSLLLIVIPEVIYIKDIYIKEYHRANTMFKLTYQSFVMFCLVFGMTLGKLIQKDKSSTGIFARGENSVSIYSPQLRLWRRLGVLIVIAVFGAHMLYPFYAIKGYYGLTNLRGLDGLQWLKTSYPDDYAAILWLKKNISGQPVILEAVGESYTDFARVSTFTGFPTVIGWRVHEWLWRGSFDEAGKRTDEVKIMFEQPDSELASSYYSMYRIRYIFVGTLERQTYALDDAKLKASGKVIFKSGDTVVIDRAV